MSFRLRPDDSSFPTASSSNNNNNRKHGFPANQSQNPPSEPSFDAPKFLKTKGINEAMKKLYEAVLDFRPENPLQFAEEFLGGLADDEEVEVNEGLKRTITKSSSPPLPHSNLISAIQYIGLKMEIERLSRTRTTKGSERRKRLDVKLHDVLSTIFLTLINSESGDENNDGKMKQARTKTIKLTTCNSLFARLSNDLKIPSTTSSHLISSLSSETGGKGGERRVTIAQFCGVGRSLVGILEFGHEAERFCSLMSAKSSGGVSVKNDDTPFYAIDAPVIDGEALLRSLPTTNRTSKTTGENTSKVRRGSYSGNDGDVEDGLREAILDLLSNKRGGGGGIEVGDLIKAGVGRK